MPNCGFYRSNGGADSQTGKERGRSPRNTSTIMVMRSKHVDNRNRTGTHQ